LGNIDLISMAKQPNKKYLSLEAEMVRIARENPKKKARAEAKLAEASDQEGYHPWYARWYGRKRVMTSKSENYNPGSSRHYKEKYKDVSFYCDYSGEQQV